MELYYVLYLGYNIIYLTFWQVWNMLKLIIPWCQTSWYSLAKPDVVRYNTSKNVYGKFFFAILLQFTWDPIYFWGTWHPLLRNKVSFNWISSFCQILLFLRHLPLIRLLQLLWQIWWQIQQQRNVSSFWTTFRQIKHSAVAETWKETKKQLFDHLHIRPFTAVKICYHQRDGMGSSTANGKWRLASVQWWAVVFMRIPNNWDSAWRAITKFDWQLGRYVPSSPSSTKELHGWKK